MFFLFTELKMLKRLALLTFLMISFAAQTFAACDYLNMCPAYTEDLTSKTAGFFSKLTGSNFLAEQIAQNMIESELKKATGQNFKASIKAITANDLVAGKFKSLEITGNDIIINGIYLSSVTIKTLCDYNSIDIAAKPTKFRENLVLEVSAEISTENLRNTIEYGGYGAKISQANLSEIGMSTFTPYSSTIEIKDSKLYFSGNAVPTGPFFPLDIYVGADIKVNQGKIESSKIEIINLYTEFDLTSVTNFVQYLNNLNYTINLLGNPQSKLQIQNINILGNKIFLNGVIFIPKN